MNQAVIIKEAMERSRMVDTLLADERYAELVLRGGKVINTLTREIYLADVAVQSGRILMAGDVKTLIGPDTIVVNIEGMYISPGFIDSHMHFESSMLTITEFSRLSIPSGTTTLIADPHEIGNALGIAGIKAMADEAGTVPNTVKLVVPALAPDCPSLETSGADIDSKDMDLLLNYPHITGIGELQGASLIKHVYDNTPEVLSDLISSVSYAQNIGKTIDGNAPGLYGAELAAHILMAGGKTSCHETTSKQECIEKLRQGMYVFMREGSTQRNMAECIRAVTEEGIDSRRCILATDDMLADDLKKFGHMNEIIRRTIRQGIDPVEAIQMATSNPAAYFGLDDCGVITPGAAADLAIISDLIEMKVEAVFLKGRLAAKSGKLLLSLPAYHYPVSVKNSVKRSFVTEDDLRIQSDRTQVTGRCIVVIPEQNLTDAKEVPLYVNERAVQCDVKDDIIYMCNVERYGRTGNIGKCFVSGFGMKKGAIAESVAHDTHNIMAVGTNLKDLAAAVNNVIKMGGGITAAKNGRIIGELALPVGGLISDDLSGEEVSERMMQLEKAVEEQMEGNLHAPFMHLSFLALSTSPKWKLTDKGLMDVENFRILDPIY